MWVLCLLVTSFCVWLVENTWHNVYITVGLSAFMAFTSGIFCAADARRQQEGNGNEEE